MRHLALLLPGDPRARTGGTRYDMRMAHALRPLGWDVQVQALHASFPQPDTSALAHAGQVLGALPEGTLALCDGLAFGAMPDIAGRHRRRLRLVALVHHPLAMETGLDPALAARLADSERRALCAARHVVTTGAATAGLLRARYGVPGARLSVVTPGTDPAPRATGSPGPHVSLLCVASVTPRKGHDILVAALARLARRDWRLTCAGSLTRDPATAQALRSAIAAAGLDGRIRLLGEVADPALARCYREADVFVLPTRLEGYGMVLAEALAHGLPVITTAGGAAADTVGPDTALLVPPDDPAALTRALDALIGSPALRRRLAGAARARALPSWEQSALAMHRILERVARP